MTRTAWTCALCTRPADDALILGTSVVRYAEVPLCNGHLAAIRLDDWWLTVKVLDTYASTGGHRLAGNDEGAEGP